MPLLIKLGLVFLGTVIFLIVFEGSLTRGTEALADRLAKGLRRIQSGKIGPWAFLLFTALFLAGGCYMIILPSREELANALANMFGLDLPGSTNWALFGAQIVIALLLIGIFGFALEFRKLRHRLAGLMLLISVGVVCTLQLWPPVMTHISLGSPSNSITETLLAMEDSRLSLLAPVPWDRDIVNNRAQRISEDLRKAVYIIWPDPLISSPEELRLSYSIQEFRPSGQDVKSMSSFEITATKPPELARHLIDTIYNQIGIKPPTDIRTENILPANNLALSYFVNGLNHLCEYTEEDVQNALAEFDSALVYDSCHGYSHLYKAYSYCILVDRKWHRETGGGSLELPYPGFADSVSLYFDRAKQLTRSESCSFINESELERHFLYSWIQGLFYQVYGRLYLAHYRRAADPTSFLSLMSLDQAQELFERAKIQYIESTTRYEGLFKVMSNLSVVYADLHEVSLQKGDTSQANVYLNLAFQTIEEAVRLDPTEPGFLINSATYKVQAYTSRGRQDISLLDRAQELLDNASESSPKKFWEGYLHYNNSCVASLRGSYDSAVESLCRALSLRDVSFDPVNVARFDEDLDSLRIFLGPGDFNSLLDACTPPPEFTPETGVDYFENGSAFQAFVSVPLW